MDFDAPAASSWAFARFAAGAALLVDVGRRSAVDPEVLLAGTGLTEANLVDHDQRVTAEQELRIIRNLQRAAPQLSGTSVGRAYHASAFGPLGFALLTSATLGDAANLALRYIDLSFAFSIPSAHLDGEDVVIEVDDRDLPADVRRFVVERDLVAIWQVLREVAADRPVASQVVLPWSPPATEAGATELREAFGVMPRWDAAARRPHLRMAASWLDLPLPQANRHACALAEAMCRDLVGSRRGPHGIVDQVRVLIAQHLESGAPMAAVGADLGLSERSLRRRLAEAGTTYRAELDDVRSTAASDLLAGDLDLDEVARRLGYAEASSLVVAHRRWTGRTPRAAG